MRRGRLPILAMLAAALLCFNVRAGASMAFDHSGNLFVATSNRNAIVKFGPDGTRTTFATGVAGALAFDAAGNLFVGVSDATGTILKFTPDGARSTFLSNVGNPCGLAFDAAGNLFVFDLESGSIFKFTPNGNKSTLAQGKKPPGQMFANSMVIACDREGNVLAADTGRDTIFRFAPDGTRTTFASKIKATDLAFDSGGNLFVADFFGNKLLEFAPDGTRGPVKVEVSGPEGLACDSAGNTFVSDFLGTIFKVTPDGTRSTFAENRPEPAADAPEQAATPKPGAASSIGLPEKYAQNFLVASSTISPDKKFAVICPTLDFSESPEAKDYMVALQPFSILRALETKWPYFEHESHGGISAAWSDDSSVALVTLDRKWGPGDFILVEFQGGQISRMTNLADKIRALLEPDYRKTKAKPYNDYFHFIFETQESEAEFCELEGAKLVRVDAYVTNDPKGLVEHIWRARLRATWDIAKGEFTQEKVTRLSDGKTKD